MRTGNPKIQVERTGVDMLLEVTALILTAIPIFYLITGGSRSWDMVIFSGVMVFDFIIFSVIQRFPHTYNYLVRITEENAEAQYQIAVSMMGWMNLILSGGMALMFFGMANLSVVEWDHYSIWIMLPFIGSIFGALGYFILKSWRCK